MTFHFDIKLLFTVIDQQIFFFILRIHWTNDVPTDKELTVKNMRQEDFKMDKSKTHICI